MCELIQALAYATMAIGTIASGVTTVVGGIQQAKAQEEEADYQAKVARQNAEIANENAAQARQQGIEDARNIRMKALSTIGLQQAQMAANGMNIGDGSALDTIEDTAMLGEMDALSTMYNAEQNAVNFEQQGANFLNQANLQEMAGRNAAKASRINGVAGGLNAIAKSGNMVSNAWSGVSNGDFANKVKGFGSSLKSKAFSWTHRNNLTMSEYDGRTMA